MYQKGVTAAPLAGTVRGRGEMMRGRTRPRILLKRYLMNLKLLKITRLLMEMKEFIEEFVFSVTFPAASSEGGGEAV